MWLSGCMNLNFSIFGNIHICFLQKKTDFSPEPIYRLSGSLKIKKICFPPFLTVVECTTYLHIHIYYIKYILTYSLREGILCLLGRQHLRGDILREL